MPKTIGRYEIHEELGRGGMAAVYLAFDSRLDRRVALKLMDQQLSVDPAFTARFEREAKTVAALTHSAIVSLYDFGDADGWLYLVMPYMKGGTLKEQIISSPLSPKQAYNVIRRIGSALDKAHSQNIIHRDLKPANILLDEEQEPYLSDFGIVKVAKGETEYLTETGQTLGTYAYMSPEQIMGRPIDGRSDLYALGIVLYEMMTGKHPFGEVATTGAMVVAHTQQTVPDVTLNNPELPAALNGVIRKAMAKDPGDRYGDGRSMTLALYDALAGKPTVVATGAGTSKGADLEATAPESSPPAQAADNQGETDKQPNQEQPPGAATGQPKARPGAREIPKTPVWIFAVVGVVALACIGIVAMASLSAIGGSTEANRTEVAKEVTRLAEEILDQGETGPAEVTKRVEEPTREPTGKPPISSSTAVVDEGLALDLTGQTVTILTGVNETLVALLEDSLRDFEEQSGVDVIVERVDDFESVVMSRADSGDPPDIYYSLWPSFMAELARKGYLVDMNQFLDSEYLNEQFQPSWLEMGSVDGHLYGLWREVYVWSHVWYSKRAFDELGLVPPQSWDEMLNLTEHLAAEGITPWCVGVGDGAASGWIGTFWIEEILLRAAGPAVRDQWVAGDLPFNSPEVRRAFELMGQIWSEPTFVHGGTGTIAETYFGDAAMPMFEDPPGCVFLYSAEFITTFFPRDAEFGDDFDYFYLPSIDEASFGKPVLITGRAAGMGKDTAAGRAVMEYLTTGESMRAQVQAGYAVAPHEDVPLSWYPNDLQRGYAEILANASVIRTNGSELMPIEVGQGSFWAGIVDFANGADLDTVLDNIDASWP